MALLFRFILISLGEFTFIIREKTIILTLSVIPKYKKKNRKKERETVKIPLRKYENLKGNFLFRKYSFGIVCEEGRL